VSLCLSLPHPTPTSLPVPVISAAVAPFIFLVRDPHRPFLPLSVKYRESTDGLTVTAIFDLPHVKKDDMHVSFQGNRLVVTWRVVRIIEREGPLNAGDLGSSTRILREAEHKKYSRTIPLPEGTKVHLTPDGSHPRVDRNPPQFEEIRAARDGRHLVLTYPNISTSQAGASTHVAP